MSSTLRVAASLAVAGVAFLGSISPALTQPEFDPVELKAWADETFGEAFEERRLSGAAVGVVRGGETLLLEAYGWEDAVHRIPLDPQRSRLRMCSLSKSFTAVSALQLIERGFLPDLDTPVNQHLERFELPPPWGDEITLRHLMTHTSGMTGGGTPQGAHTDIPAPVRSEELARMLRENLIREPGQISLYANLGVALEGALIEDVSGLSLAQYMAKNIFEPLGMGHTLLHHSLSLPDNLATPAARFPNGDLQPVAFYPKHPSAAASGGIIATPADMLRYAAFHADPSPDSYADVLTRESRAMMQRAHFRAHPRVDGVGLHLYPRRYGDYAMASHGCGLPGFASYLAVIPELELGVYFTLMSAAPVPSLGDLVQKLFAKGRLVPSDAAPAEKRLASTTVVWDSFAERFLPPRALPDPSGVGAEILVSEASVDTAARVERVGRDENIESDGGDGSGESIETISPPASFDPEELYGTYWVERRSFTSLAKVFASGGTRRVSAGTEEATLEIGDKLYRALGGGAFERVDDPFNRVVFRRVSNGDLYLTSSSAAWRKVGVMNDPGLWGVSLALGLLGLLSGLLSPLWRLPSTAGTPQRFAWIKPRTFALIAAIGVVALALPFNLGSETVAQAVIEYYNNDYLRMTLFLLILNGVLGIGVLLALATVRSWRQLQPSPGLRTWLSLTHASLMSLAAFALLGAMVFFNLLGVQLY